MSTQLFLVRHAIAFERDTKRWPDDAARPLTEEGIRRARRAAAGAKRVLERPELVLTSPLVRARDTAAVFTQAAGWPKAEECEVLAPGKSQEAVLETLRRKGAKAECIAVVGHQPALGQLLALCLAGIRTQAFEIKKGAIVCLRFEGSLRPGQAMLTALLPSRVLRKS